MGDQIPIPAFYTQAKGCSLYEFRPELITPDKFFRPTFRGRLRVACF